MSEPLRRRSRLSSILRWLAGSLVLPLGWVLILAYRGQVAERLLNETLEEYRKLGEPVSIADLQPAPVSEDDNAAADLLAAGAWLERVVGGEDDLKSVEFALPWSAKELSYIRTVLEKTRPSLERARAAKNKRGIDWGVQLKSPLLLMRWPAMAQQRKLTNHLAAGALEAHFRGDDASAMEYIEDMLCVSRSVDRMPAGSVSHLVALGVQAMACSIVRQIAPDLNVGGGGGEVARERVQALIRSLLDDALLREGQRRSLLVERVQVVDSYRNILAGTFDNGGRGATPDEMTPWKRFLTRSTTLTEARLGAEYATAAIATASQANDRPAMLANPNNLEVDMKRHPDRYRSIASILIPTYYRAIQTHFRLLTDSNAAAIALAMRLYALEHGGKLPSKLEALVPKYLPAVPGDTMAAGSPSLHYIPDERDPRIYSVGNNGKDDGGSESPERPGKDDSGVWERLDVVYHYFRQPRAEGSQQEE